MRETDDDLKQLQTLVSESIDGAGSYLRQCFEMPQHCLSAAQLARHFEGLKTVAIATVTAKGEPRTAPVAAIFYRGQFHIPTVADSARARQIPSRPAVSLSYFDANDLAVAENF